MPTAVAQPVPVTHHVEMKLLSQIGKPRESRSCVKVLHALKLSKNLMVLPALWWPPIGKELRGGQHNERVPGPITRALSSPCSEAS